LYGIEDKSMTSDQDHDVQRRLILMRHAKSDWGDEDLSDHDRPLNKRGRRDAPRMAQWLAENDLVPELILSSTSVRTRQTVSLLLEIWNAEPTQLYLEELYHAGPAEITAAVAGDGGDALRLMVVAHNPGMASLVSTWAGTYSDMPTAAVAVFQLDRPWRELPAADVELVDFMRPKAL